MAGAKTKAGTKKAGTKKAGKKKAAKKNADAFSKLKAHGTRNPSFQKL